MSKTRAISFIIKFCLNAVNPPPPPPIPVNVVVVEEILEGLKYNISLRGGGTQGEGIDNYVYSAEKGCFTKVSQHLSLITGYCSFYTKSELLQVSQWLLMN